MFDLESAIAEWRKRMLAGGITSPVPLDELEGHLRDEFSRLRGSSVSEAEQFQIAVGQMGEAMAVKQEFSKLEHGRFWKTDISLKILGFWFVLMGLSYFPVFWVLGLPGLSMSFTLFVICGIQIIIGVGLMRRVNFWRWCALVWIALFVTANLTNPYAAGEAMRRVLWSLFILPIKFNVRSLSGGEIIFANCLDVLERITNFLSPVILIWGAWLLTQRNVRKSIVMFLAATLGASVLMQHVK